VLRAFRFDPVLYAGFKRFPDVGREKSGVEAEAKVC
jgi:hypothetical protein